MRFEKVLTSCSQVKEVYLVTVLEQGLVHQEEGPQEVGLEDQEADHLGVVEVQGDPLEDVEALCCLLI